MRHQTTIVVRGGKARAMKALDREVRRLEGVRDDLDREIAGCAFTPRCDSAFSPCPTTHPRRLEITRGHEAQCHLNDHLVAERPA